MNLNQVNLKAKDHLRNPYSPGFAPMDIPEGKSGNWSVVRYTVTDSDLGIYNLRLIRDGQYQRILPPGTYTRLMHGGATVMSDTPAESHEHARLLRQAKGRILLNGLGLGFCLAAILRKEGVESVTVIEKSHEVIALCAGQFLADKRVHIIQGDALVWRPPTGVKYDVVWHDIWTNVMNSDDKSTATKLRRAYAQRCKWQSCWSEEYAHLSR